MKPIRTIIVDDEAPARDELRYLLSRYPDIDIIDEAESSQEALLLIARQQPELIFLDIQMPGKSGLELMDELGEQQPLVVLTTAYDNYAVQAFEKNAIDYILKPLSEKRLAQTISKVRKIGGNKLENQLHTLLQQVAPAAQPANKKISVEKEGRMMLISLEEITHFIYESGRIIVHSKEDASCLYGIATMDKLEEHLCGSSFFRAHRALLVNLDYIKEFSPWFNGKYCLIMGDDKRSELSVSRARVKAFKQRLGI